MTSFDHPTDTMQIAAIVANQMLVSVYMGLAVALIMIYSTFIQIRNSKRKDEREPVQAERDARTQAVCDRYRSAPGSGHSVIGEPDKVTKTLELGIFDREVELHEDGEQPAYSSPVGHANIGFNRADWEHGTQDQWYVSMYVPKAAFDPLFSAVGEGKVSRMHLVLRLKVYATHHPVAPGTRAENLFLTPADPSETLPASTVHRGGLQRKAA